MPAVAESVGCSEKPDRWPISAPEGGDYLREIMHDTVIHAGTSQTPDQGWTESLAPAALPLEAVSVDTRWRATGVNCPATPPVSSDCR